MDHRNLHRATSVCAVRWMNWEEPPFGGRKAAGSAIRPMYPVESVGFQGTSAERPLLPEPDPDANGQLWPGGNLSHPGERLSRQDFGPPDRQRREEHWLSGPTVGGSDPRPPCASLVLTPHSRAQDEIFEEAARHASCPANGYAETEPSPARWSLSAGHAKASTKNGPADIQHRVWAIDERRIHAVRNGNIFRRNRS